MKRALEVKQKIFFLISQVLFFSLKKQTGKIVAGTTLKPLTNLISKDHFLCSRFHQSKVNIQQYYQV